MAIPGQILGKKRGGKLGSKKQSELFFDFSEL